MPIFGAGSYKFWLFKTDLVGCMYLSKFSAPQYPKTVHHSERGIFHVFQGKNVFSKLQVFVKINIRIERHYGVGVRAPACGEEGPWMENRPQSCERKTFLCSSSSKRVSDSLQSWVGREGLGGKGRGDRHHPSHAVPSDTCEP